MQPDQRAHLVWDLPLRLWHWALVLCLAGSWITAEAGFEWQTTHFYFGYSALALVVFRFAWGLLGTRHSRYGSFLVAPRTVVAYLQGTKTQWQRAGHTPLGGWASLLLVVIVGVQATTGLFISDDIFYAGPYNSVISSSTADALAGWHHRIFTLLQILAVLHLTAVGWYTWGRKERLLHAMLHGKKRLGADAQGQTISSHRGLLALLLIGLAALLIAALVYFAPTPNYDFY